MICFSPKLAAVENAPPAAADGDDPVQSKPADR